VFLLHGVGSGGGRGSVALLSSALVTFPEMYADSDLWSLGAPDRVLAVAIYYSGLRPWSSRYVTLPCSLFACAWMLPAAVYRLLPAFLLPLFHIAILFALCILCGSLLPYLSDYASALL